MAALTRRERISALLFITLALVALASVLIALYGWKKGPKPVPYSLRFVDSVTNLDQGAPVRYKGLRCGSVETLRLDPDDPNAVIVELAIDPGTPIKRSTTARVGSASLLGPYFIELTNSRADSPVLEPGSQIAAEASTFSRLLATGESVGDRLPVLLDNLGTWVVPERRDQVFRVIQDLDDLIVRARASLDELTPEARRLLSNWGDLANLWVRITEEQEPELRRLMVELNRTMQEARRVLEGADTRSLSERAQETLDRVNQELTATAGAIREFLGRNDVQPELAKLAATAARLEATLTRDIGALANQGRDTLRADIGPAALGFSRAGRALERVAQLLERSPRALLFGEPPAEKPLPQIPPR